MAAIRQLTGVSYPTRFSNVSSYMLDAVAIGILDEVIKKSSGVWIADLSRSEERVCELSVGRIHKWDWLLFSS